VEELTKAMLESGLVSEESERFVLTGPMRSMAVPSTLHDSLLARLDRLSVVKEVAQAGAAIGREFAHATLAAVLSLDPVELNHSLARLTDAGLIHSRGLPPDAVYSFKHALIQDAAYTTMLRPRRQRLHARIAQVLQADAELAQRSPELLAHHFTEADQPEMAVPYRLAAGLQASAGAAHAEACKHFREGLRLAAAMKDDDLRHRLELRLNVHLGMSLAATRGFAAPEVEASNQRARELCQLVGDPDELFWVLRGLCALYIVRADAKTAHELSAQCVRLAQETQRPEFLVEACVMEGYAQGNFGDLTRAREALGQAVQTYRSTAAGRFAYPTPQDPLVASLSLLAVLTLIQGDRAAAAEQMQDAIATAEALERPFDLAFAYTWAAMFESQDRNFAGAAEHAGRAMEISQRHGFDGWLAAGAMQLGVAQAGLGDAPQALALVGGTLPAWQASGAELNIVFFLGGLAEAHHAAGHNEQALETVDRAIAHAEQHGEHWYDAELYRRRGEWRLQQAGAASANAGAAEGEADLRRAIEIAREQGARRFELRAALGLAHALAAVGDRAGAVPVLREALQPFPTATDNIDQREAAALLAELAA
jgi:predicted ATPase